MPGYYFLHCQHRIPQMQLAIGGFDVFIEQCDSSGARVCMFSCYDALNPSVPAAALDVDRR